MRNIKEIVIHCSATGPSANPGVAEIRRWHINANAWRDIGYHYLIRRDGSLEKGRPLAQAGAHVAGHNRYSIGICLVGGLDHQSRPVDNFTVSQKDELKNLLIELKKNFPKARILGHRDFPGVKKACPCFDVKTWLKNEGLL